MTSECNAECGRVVITLQDTTPDYRELIRREIYRLHAHVVALPRGVHLSTRVTYWLSVLGHLGREVDTLGPSVHPGEHRSKRALFDFIGELSHSLFGTATDDEIVEIRQKVEENRQVLSDLVHYGDNLLTVINATHADMVINRQAINEIINSTRNLRTWADTVTKQLAEGVRGLVTYNVIREKVDAIRSQVGTLRSMVGRHARRRADLERGLLTEELLPLDVLEGVANLENLNGLELIRPLWWYYSNVKIQPLWDDKNLAYLALLPLTDGVPYLRYEIQSFPLMVGNATVDLGAHGTVGVESTSGSSFEADQCFGHRPVVCASAPIRMHGPPTCLQAIALQLKPALHCVATITSDAKDTAIRSLSGYPNSIVVLTKGETIHELCPGLPGKTRTLQTGTYWIDWLGECVLMTAHYKLVGVRQRKTVKTLLQDWHIVQDIKIGDLAQPHVKALAAAPPVGSHVKPTHKVVLQLPPQPPAPITWLAGKNGWRPWIIGLMAMIAVMLMSWIACYLWKRSQKPCKKKPSVEKSHVIEEPAEPAPEAVTPQLFGPGWVPSRLPKPTGDATPVVV